MPAGHHAGEVVPEVHLAPEVQRVVNEDRRDTGFAVGTGNALGQVLLLVHGDAGDALAVDDQIERLDHLHGLR